MILMVAEITRLMGLFEHQKCGIHLYDYMASL